MEIHEGREHLLQGGGRDSDLPVKDWDKATSDNPSDNPSNTHPTDHALTT